jgi:enolase-phosphatase E1
VRRRGILLDIEGTTTPISFVYDVLFPFARKHAAEYLEHTTEDLDILKSEYAADVKAGLAPPVWSDVPVDYVRWLMDHDRKSTGLKQLQGRIWEKGYREGRLKGKVFPDVPRALERWRAQKIDVRIFSSGSVLAQKLLFSSTAKGDLTLLLKGFFDTTTGPKLVPKSYGRIAARFALAPSEIVFVSDITRELDAARIAGLQTILCIRPGNPAQDPNGHPAIRSFDKID